MSGLGPLHFGKWKGRVTMMSKIWQNVGLKLLVLLIGVTTASSLFAADKHPFGLDDYSVVRRAVAVAVSPDGKSLAAISDIGAITI